MISKQLGTSPDWSAVENRYRYDSDVKFKGRKRFNTAEGIQIHVDNTGKHALDTATCLDSSLTLTSRKKLSDFIELSTPAAKFPRTYVTYFADVYGWVDNIAPSTRCWYVESSTKTQEQMERDGELPEFNFTTPYSEMSPEMLFEVELLNDRYMRIGHWDGYKKTFLTSNDRRLSVNFQFENNLLLNKANPQVFEYSLDETISCISIYRQIGDEYFEFKYIPRGKLFTYVNTSHYNYIPNTFKNAVSRTDAESLVLNESWVHYNSGLKSNDITIDPTKSNFELTHNYILNTEHVYDDSPVNNYNIITLKNHINSRGTLSINNPFNNSVDVHYHENTNQPEPQSLYRDYTSLNQGPGGDAGYSNIYANYTDYTRQLIFKADELTYFHTPPSMYPYNKLNIAESGLIESGAIAGDMPIKSDKVFKKRADYEHGSPWGNPTDEHTGTYLCSWLYWSGDDKQSPMWLDRYYNPRDFTVHQALTAVPLVDFVTTFDNMVLENPSVDNYVVFDKVSDLCFEPSSLYCYHRIGQTDINNTIRKLNANIVQTNLSRLQNVAGDAIIPEFIDNSPVYSFNSNIYGQTDSLPRLATTNSYSINFSMYSDDWSKPFGHQLLGNYTNDGFGIFNKQLITPFYFGTDANNNVVMYNTSGEILLSFDNHARLVIKNPATENIFIYNQDLGGTLYEYNTTGVLEEKTRLVMYDRTQYPPVELPALNWASDDNYIYLRYSDTSYYRFDLITETPEDIPDKIITLHATGDSSIAFNQYQHMLAIEEQVYVLDSQHPPVLDTNRDIWWLHHNSVYKYDRITQSYSIIFETADYILKRLLLDVDNNVYLVYRDYESVGGKFEYWLMSLDAEKNINFTSSLSSYNADLADLAPDEHININLVAEFNENGYEQYISLLTDYVSTFTTVDLDTGAEQINTQNMTYKTNIHTTGQLKSTTIINVPFNNIKYVATDYEKLKYRYPDNNTVNELIFKTKIKNLYNRDIEEELVLKADVTNFAPGWRHISYDFNTTIGRAVVFIDGMPVSTYDFEPMKYRYSDVSINKYTVGATPYHGGLTLGQFLKRPETYLCTNYKVKHLYIYDKSLNFYDLKFLYRQLANIRDIHWSVPGNSRNYIDEVQHTFTHKRPPMKSNRYDINILCDTIQDTELRQKLTTDIVKYINNDTPVNSEIDNITWYTTK